MTSRIFQLSALLAAFVFVATTSACPKDSKCGSKKGAAALTSVKAVEDGRSAATTKASAKTPDSKSGKKAGCGKKGCGGTGCDKPDCCKNKAAMAKLKAATNTVATTTKKSPCSKSGKKGGCGKKGCGGTGCDKPDCCKNKAAIAALKSLTATKTTGKTGGSKPCCKKKGSAVAAGTPCSGKCASCPDCKKNPAGCSTCKNCKSGAKTASATAASSGKGCCKKKEAAVVADANAPCGKKCGTKKTTAVVGADGVKRCPLTGKPIKDEDCPIGKKVDAVLTSLPTMKYKIGNDVTCCSKSAAAMAKKSSTKMQYLVGDDVFSTEKEASAKLVAAYEMEVNNLNSMQFSVGSDCFHCPMTAKGKAKVAGKKMAYRVAGFDFPEKSKAEDALKKIALTVADVTMSYKVGDQKFCCDKMAGAKVKETGSTMSYIVGDVETTDEFSAKMKLAEAKIRAIIRTAYTAMGS